MEIKCITGERIKALRTEMGLKMYQLGEKIGVSKSCISNYESGYNVPSRENLLRLSELFNVNIDYLLGKTELRDRFLNYVIGMKVPIYENDDIEALIHKNESKMTGLINVPKLAEVKDDVMETFSVKMPDSSMDNAGIYTGSYVIVVRSNSVPNGKVAAVAYDKKVYICRIHCFENHITLIPDSCNKNYMPIQVDKSEAVVLGMVKQVINNVN